MSDFNISRSGKICELSGHLVDSTSLNEFEHEFALTREFNLSKLYSVSWLGLLKLIAVLERLKLRAAFTEIPAHIFRLLLIIQNKGSTIRIKSIEVEVRDPARKISRRIVSMDHLVNIGLLTGSFVTLDDGALVLGSLHHLGRPVIIEPTLPHPNFVNSWCRKNAEHALFWYDYTSFVASIIETCALAQQANARLIEDSLQFIFTSISAAESALKILVPGFNETRAKSLLELMPKVNEVNHSTVAALNACRVPYTELLHALQDHFLNKWPDAKAFLDHVGKLVILGSGLEPLSKTLDNIGLELCQRVAEYGEIEHLRNRFRDVDPVLVSEKNLASVRRKLKFHVEGSSGADWAQTLREVEKEFEGLAHNLASCIAAIQGFEPIRQVLEHRIHESTILEKLFAGLCDGTLAWEQVCKEILGEAAGKLVTDQEKAAFAFFFPGARGA